MLKTTYTLAEAAQLLSCHPETLRRAIKEGSLRAARLGREYRISRMDLQGFWTTRGGWDLFGDEPMPAPPRKESKAPQKPHGARQLSLFPSPAPSSQTRIRPISPVSPVPEDAQ